MQWWIEQEPTQDEGEEEGAAGEGEQHQPHPRDVAEDQDSEDEGVPADIQQDDTR